MIKRQFNVKQARLGNDQLPIVKMSTKTRRKKADDQSGTEDKTMGNIRADFEKRTQVQLEQKLPAVLDAGMSQGSSASAVQLQTGGQVRQRERQAQAPTSRRRSLASMTGCAFRLAAARCRTSLSESVVKYL